MRSLFLIPLLFTQFILLANTYINVKNYGATGNGITNDFTAIQNAIDNAEVHGAVVFLPVGIYNVDQTLIVPSGVTLLGEGRGSTSTSTPYNGTIIKNIGVDQTIRITGQNATIKSLVVYDTDNVGAAGGIEIIASNCNVESVVLEEVLIFGFTSGSALKLEANNSGGVNYCTFYDVRIRHAKIGIEIKSDATSNVNSNSFFHGAISGGGFDHCLLVSGGNNNVFNGMVMEPYSSQFGHLVVEEGQIIAKDMRIEGIQQSGLVPLIEFKANTHNSIVSGRFSGGLTIDEGNNFINLSSDKSLNFENSNSNLFVNANFSGVKDNKIPFWDISNEVTVTPMPSEILSGYQVLKLTVPVGVETYLKPASGFVPSLLSRAKYDYVNFGAYIKTNVSGVVTTICKSPDGISTGTFHSGTSKWQMIGMTSGVDHVGSYDPKFYIKTTGQTEPVVIYVTTPMLNFGNTAVKLEAAPITSAGGIITGTLTKGVNSATVSNHLSLPHEGNMFEISGAGTISRINHLTQDRFPKGTVITLLFDNAGINVTSGGYLNLISGYASNANSSLTLMSKGDGTWREVDRNVLQTTNNTSGASSSAAKAALPIVSLAFLKAIIPNNNRK